MKQIRIPSWNNPFTVTVNGCKYSYTAGSLANVPDEVAEAIENVIANMPKTSETDKLAFESFVKEKIKASEAAMTAYVQSWANASKYVSKRKSGGGLQIETISVPAGGLALYDSHVDVKKTSNIHYYLIDGVLNKFGSGNNYYFTFTGIYEAVDLSQNPATYERTSGMVYGSYINNVRTVKTL